MEEWKVFAKDVTVESSEFLRIAAFERCEPLRAEGRAFLSTVTALAKTFHSFNVAPVYQLLQKKQVAEHHEGMEAEFELLTGTPKRVTKSLLGLTAHSRLKSVKNRQLSSTISFRLEHYLN